MSNTETPITYSAFVATRAKDMGSPMMDTLHMAVGISGEAGELLDAVKKAWVYQKPLDLINVAEELGDLLFYIQGMANIHGWDLEDVMDSNRDKLMIRYPKRYTDEDAQARADKATSVYGSRQVYSGDKDE